MNLTQKILSTLLAASIRENEIKRLDFDKINWEEVYEESKAHAVSALIYPTIKALSKSCNIPNELMEDWTKDAIMNGIYQNQNISRMKKVFKVFEESCVPVIAIKGLILRDLYPRPEFRTMSDSDLLINSVNTKDAEKVLMDLGYSKLSSIGHESCFVHDSAFSIDLHWSLINEDHLKNTAHFQNTLWQNLRTYDFHGVKIKALSLEYELIHLFIHMASHMIKSGFGVRQLCDIVVFIEKEGCNINWDIVSSLGDLCKLNKFINTILIICNNLFNLDIPKAYNKSYPNSKEYIKFLTNEIWESGVYGCKNEERASSIMLFAHNFKANSNTNIYKLILRYLFPSKDRLDKRFSYAVKYPSLLVFAWIHRLIYQLFFNASLRIKNLIKLKSTASLVRDRFELIKWLQL